LGSERRGRAWIGKRAVALVATALSQQTVWLTMAIVFVAVAVVHSTTESAAVTTAEAATSMSAASASMSAASSAPPDEGEGAFAVDDGFAIARAGTHGNSSRS